jgi:hypothetical protein
VERPWRSWLRRKGAINGPGAREGGLGHPRQRRHQGGVIGPGGRDGPVSRRKRSLALTTAQGKLDDCPAWGSGPRAVGRTAPGRRLRLYTNCQNLNPSASTTPHIIPVLRLWTLVACAPPHSGRATLISRIAPAGRAQVTSVSVLKYRLPTAVLSSFCASPRAFKQTILPSRAFPVRRVWRQSAFGNAEWWQFQSACCGPLGLVYALRHAQRGLLQSSRRYVDWPGATSGL